MKKILILLLFPLFLAGQCPIFECDPMFQFPLNPSECNGFKGNRCYYNDMDGFAYSTSGVIFGNQWQILSFYNTGVNQILVTSPLEINDGQKVYYTGALSGTGLINELSMRGNAVIYLDGNINVPKLGLSGINYVYMSEGSIFRYDGTEFQSGEVLQMNGDDFIYFLQCGKSSITESKNDIKIPFTIYPLTGYILNGKKYIVIQ